MEGMQRLGAAKGKVFRLLDIVEDSHVKNVPDPYYTGNFDEVYQLAQRGCEALLERIRNDHQM